MDRANRFPIEAEIAADLKAAQNAIEFIERRIKQLEAQLESEQPKLRHGEKHGDYGIVPAGFDCDKPHPVLSDPSCLEYGKGYWKKEDGSDSCGYDSKNGLRITHKGNIFDDLSAMSEDVEWYETNSKIKIRVKLSGENIEFYIKGGMISGLNIEQAQKFHRKLGAMIFKLAMILKLKKDQKRGKE